MNPSQSRLLKIFTSVAAVASWAMAGASPFNLNVQPVFQGNVGNGSPVVFDIENAGAEAKGVLHVDSGQFSMDYPVDLAARSTSKVVCYLGSNNNFWMLNASLDTDRGSESKIFPSFGGANNGASVLLIGGRFGDLQFINHPLKVTKDSSPGDPGNTVNDLYCSAADAPSRAAGYQAVKAVFLDRDAANLSDESVRALETWTLQGGTLVFVGDPSSKVLVDKRWSDVLPVSDFKPVTIDGSETLSSMGQSKIGAVTLLEPADLRGAAVRADGSNTITAEWGFGLGRVVYLAYDPFSDPVAEWTGRPAAVYDAIKSSFINGYQQAFFNQNISGPPGVVEIGAKSAFDAKLPSLAQVFEILAGYFLAVVPLNFLILRKFKKAEWAWFTAPVLSIGFASMLFKSASSLYGNDLATASDGVLVVRDGVQKGVFIGTTELFIPHGGRYDLKMSGVDSLGGADANGSLSPYGAVSDADFGPVDTGEVTMPHVLASNLAFRRIDYHQQISVDNQYSLSMRREGGSAICVVKNNSDQPLGRATLMVGRHYLPVGLIPAKSVKTFAIDLKSNSYANQSAGGSGIFDALDTSVGYYGGAALLADMTGFRPGPQIGDQVASHSLVQLMLFSKDSLGGTR